MAPLMRWTVRSRSAAATRRLGVSVGRVLAAGTVIGLEGNLGAGKTLLVQGLAEGLAVRDLGSVVSPTYALVHEYLGRVPLVHVDLYRLHGVAEVVAFGVEEQLHRPDAVVVVEWAERAREALPPGAAWLRIEATGARSRRIVADGLPRPTDVR